MKRGWRVGANQGAQASRLWKTLACACKVSAQTGGTPILPDWCKVRLFLRDGIMGIGIKPGTRIPEVQDSS